ncbi:MAG: hypothetical protein DRO11_01885, partial [Methanobacteriota archaeon]
IIFSLFTILALVNTYQGRINLVTEQGVAGEAKTLLHKVAGSINKVYTNGPGFQQEIKVPRDLGIEGSSYKIKIEKRGEGYKLRIEFRPRAASGVHYAWTTLLPTQYPDEEGDLVDVLEEETIIDSGDITGKDALYVVRWKEEAGTMKIEICKKDECT